MALLQVRVQPLLAQMLLPLPWQFDAVCRVTLVVLVTDPAPLVDILPASPWGNSITRFAFVGTANAPFCGDVLTTNGGVMLLFGSKLPVLKDVDVAIARALPDASVVVVAILNV